MVWKKDYNEIYRLKRRKNFEIGQQARVIGTTTGGGSRLGTICKILRKGVNNHYWVQFGNEPEMIFRGAWLEAVNE